MQDMEQRVQAYWTKRARDFSTVRRNELHDGAMGRRWLTEMQRYLPQGKVLDILDVGTGTGYFAILLAREGHRLTGIESLNAILPPAGGAALVAISMALTFLAGLIPSGIAARKDPVEALRTE